MTPDEADKLANEMIVTGALFTLLDRQVGNGAVTSVEIPRAENESREIASLFVTLSFMDSRYRITVTLDPES